jgi:aminoglycoside phosphotransferase (APT) family kinase protein
MPHRIVTRHSIRHRIAHGLAALAPFLPVAIPSVEAIGSATDAYPGEWSVHRWLTGTHPSPDALTNPRRLIDTRAALASWDESLAAPYDGREVWVHSDLTPNNLLVHQTDAREPRAAGHRQGAHGSSMKSPSALRTDPHASSLSQPLIPRSVALAFHQP